MSLFFVVEAMMRVPNPAENECWRIVYASIVYCASTVKMIA
jgi:hypothetical protein